MADLLKKVAIYNQEPVSTKAGQKELEELRSFVIESGWILYREYIEPDENSLDRPAFKALRSAADRKEFDVVLVLRLDRFEVSSKGLFQTLAELKKLNIGFVSIKDRLNTTQMGEPLKRRVLMPDLRRRERPEKN